MPNLFRSAPQINVLQHRENITGKDEFTAWNWIKVTVPATTTVDIDYQYILGTGGSAGVIHFWSLDTLKLEGTDL